MLEKSMFEAALVQKLQLFAEFLNKQCFPNLIHDFAIEFKIPDSRYTLEIETNFAKGTFTLDYRSNPMFFKYKLDDITLANSSSMLEQYCLIEDLACNWVSIKSLIMSEIERQNRAISCKFE